MNHEVHKTKHQEIARDILRYLEEHPEAKDTLGGIADWWLPGGSDRLIGDVERAVSLLLSQGLILETRRRGLPPYYRLNPEQNETISETLNSSQDL